VNIYFLFTLNILGEYSDTQKISPLQIGVKYSRYGTNGTWVTRHSPNFDMVHGWVWQTDRQKDG